MRRESVAQRLLSIFVGQVRAASIVGDLLERDAAVGNLRFWYYISQISICSLGKPVLAVVLVLIGMGTFLGWLVAPSATVIHPLEGMGIWLGSVLIVLFISAIWCLVKYGWKDLFTLSILMALGLGTVWLRFRWIFPVAPIAAALASCVIVVALFHPRWRRALFALMLTIIGSEFAFASVIFLDRHLFKAGWVPPFEHSVGTILEAIFFLVLVFMVSAWSRRITIEKPRGSSSRPVAA